MKTIITILFITFSLVAFAQKAETKHAVKDSIQLNVLQLADLKQIEDWKAKAIEEINKAASNKQGEWYLSVMHAKLKKPEDYKLTGMVGDILKLEKIQ